MILAVVAGVLIILNVLWEAFETIILPRRVNRRWRVTVLFYRGTWLPWRTIARWFRKVRARETFLSFYGPLSLLTLLVFWAASLIVGFALLFYGAAHQVATPRDFETCLYLSGTTFFTLGLGDVVPHTSAGRFLAVVESGLGFGFLALVLSYLPVIYQAFSRREVNIVLLDARAGSPPTAGELLRRHAEPDGMDSLQTASPQLGTRRSRNPRKPCLVSCGHLFPLAAQQRVLARRSRRHLGHIRAPDCRH